MGTQGSVDANFAKIGSDIALFNEGLMKGLMVNPTSPTAACEEAFTAAGTEIRNMFDITAYSEGTFEFFQFIETLNIFTIQLSNEQEKCGFDKYMETMDNMFSHWDAFGGAMAAGVTDIIVAYADPSRSGQT